MVNCLQRSGPSWVRSMKIYPEALHGLLEHAPSGWWFGTCLYIFYFSIYWEQSSQLTNRRKFRSQNSDNMGRWKAEMGRVREKRRVEERRSEKRKSQKKEDADARKGRKVAKHCVFPMICGSGGSKSRLAKAAGAEPAGQMKDEKLHAVVARRAFRSQNLQNTPCSDHFWKLRCRKSARCCGAKHISKSKCTKNWQARSTFVRSDVISRGRRKGLCTLWTVSKTWGICSISKKDGRRGTFEEDLQRCILRGRRSAKDMFIRDVRRSGHWFPERGCILEHQICRFAKMILRDRCSTGRRSTLERWTGKNAKRIGTRWRKSRRIHLILMLSNSQNEEVSQNCCVFWCCQQWKMKKSRRIAAFFLMLSTLQNEEVSQNSSVSKVADRQIDR